MFIIFLFYQSRRASQDHHGSGNQMWTTRQNTRLLQTKPQGLNECVCERERDSTTLKCWHLLQALAGLECDTLLYTKGLGPCSRHKKTSICPSPRGQHTYEMTVSVPHASFSQPLTLIKTTEPSFIPWCRGDGCSARSLRWWFPSYVGLGVNCCSIASCVWLNGFNMSPALLWLLRLCCSRLPRTAGGYTGGFGQQ